MLLFSLAKYSKMNIFHSISLGENTMAAKLTKLDKFIKGADKLMDSKGVSKLAGTLDKTLNIAGDAVQAAAEVTNHQLDEHNKRHLHDVKIPDLLGLTLTQSQEALSPFDLTFAPVVATPDAKFASARVDTVIATLPKPNAVVAPGSFVKLYYVDAATLEASTVLAEEAVRRVKERKEAAKGFVAKVAHGTAAGTSHAVKAATAGVTKKLGHHDRPKNIRKEIDATIIDAQAPSEKSKE